MKSNRQAKKSVLCRPATWSVLGAVVLAGGKIPAVQSVIYSGPIVPVSPELLRDEREQNLTNSAEVFIPASEQVRSDLPDIFREGPFNFRPHLGYQFLYGTGIQSTPAINGTTAINSLSPGILVEYGQHWALDYTPTFTMYSNNKFHDTTGHSVSLTGATSYNDWKFRVGQTFESSEQLLSETGGETFQQAFNTSVSASRALNDKMSADFDFSQKILDTDNFQSSRDWSVDGFLNYQFFDRLSAGVGATFGYVDVDFGSNQTYQDASLRVSWRITDKIGLSANVGGEAREFEGADTLFTPIYGLNLEYQPRHRTQITAGVSRSVVPSLYAGQVTDSTSLNLGINQQILEKFTLSLFASYNITDYTTASGTSNRRDENTTYNARLSHPIFKRGTLSAVYQYGDNQSSVHGFSYRTDQVGAEFNYAF